MVEDFYIGHRYWRTVWKNDATENTLWLQLFIFIYSCEESLLIQGILAGYRGCPARARWGQNSRSVTQPAEYFCRGARAIRTFSGKHWAVRCRVTALWSPYRHF